MGKKKYCSWAHENGVWWSGVQVKLASAVDLLVIISNQKLFQNLRLQDQQNNEMKAWMTMEFQLLAFIVCYRTYSLSLIIDST